MNVVELFAGVGGFRLGLERASSEFHTVWSNQWEPNNKKQWAYECYVSHFNHCICKDISLIDKSIIPDCDLVVGGFPCQDYSVAHSLSTSKGIEGIKGVLWWDIYDILKLKSPKYLLFENVDRILRSPSKQIGRDFGIILSCLNELGYKVEWRVITASNYGNPQRRKRTFIFGCKQDFKPFFNELFDAKVLYNRLVKKKCLVPTDVNKFTFCFDNWGYMKDGVIYTEKVEEQVNSIVPLSSVIQEDKTNLKYLTDKQIKKLKYLKGNKKITRRTEDGYEWIYSEGEMAFPDDLSKPSRTMLTSEGSVNRCTHIIDDGGLRFLTPIECERLNGFPDNWTEGMPDRMRYFCMGNALVVPIITKIGKKILDIEGIF